ncbi:MAG: hypothetical protein HYS39_02850 [Proteobacteria bacterium]|nr:hypothetical protein [Pseudomonadota bacterium]
MTRPNLGEDINNKSFIDRLYRLEKLGYIDKAEEWFIYRRARNAASHEYPEAPELMVKNLKEIIHLAKNLLDYWSVLDQKIIQILNL